MRRNMSGSARLRCIYAFLTILWVYHSESETLLAVLALRYSLWRSCQSLNMPHQYSLSLFVFIALMVMAICLSSTPASLFGLRVSHVRHSLWICARHRCLTALGKTFLTAFMMPLPPSFVTLSTSIPRLRIFSRSSHISFSSSSSVIL